MARNTRIPGPTGSNRVDLSAPHLVRYWTAEFNCSEAELRDVVGAIGTNAGDVRRRLALRRAGAVRAQALGVARRPRP